MKIYKSILQYNFAKTLNREYTDDIHKNLESKKEFFPEISNLLTIGINIVELKLLGNYPIASASKIVHALLDSEKNRLKIEESIGKELSSATFDYWRHIQQELFSFQLRVFTDLELAQFPFNYFYNYCSDILFQLAGENFPGDYTYLYMDILWARTELEKWKDAQDQELQKRLEIILEPYDEIYRNDLVHTDVAMDEKGLQDKEKFWWYWGYPKSYDDVEQVIAYQREEFDTWKQKYAEEAR